jgi:hypothetical protein
MKKTLVVLAIMMFGLTSTAGAESVSPKAWQYAALAPLVIPLDVLASAAIIPPLVVATVLLPPAYGVVKAYDHIRLQLVDPDYWVDLSATSTAAQEAKMIAGTI